MRKQSEIGLIILAAGASVRMGKPKQLLKFSGETLLRRAVRTGKSSECRPVVVVLGANFDLVKKEIDGIGVEIVKNAEWDKGMSSSIKAGLERILEINGEIAGIIVTVCDQPFVSAEIIKCLIETHRKTDSLIVASEYSKTLGVPAFFGKKVFPLIFEIQDAGGAKKIIEQFPAETSVISFEMGEIDVDTPDDYLRLKNCKYV